MPYHLVQHSLSLLHVDNVPGHADCVRFLSSGKDTVEWLYLI